MRTLMREAIGRGQMLQTQTGFPRFRIGRPNNPLGAQGIRAAHHINQIPAATTVFKLAFIRREQIAPQHKTRHFIIKTNRVITHADGIRRSQLTHNRLRKLRLRHATLIAQLRRDAGNQCRFGRGQIIRRQLAIQHQRLANFIQIHIGAHARELRRAVFGRRQAEGFVVVPEKSRGG